MANTVAIGDGLINVTFDGSTAWDLSATYTNGVRIQSLSFVPTATDDILTVREGSATGKILWQVVAENAYDMKDLYLDGRLRQLYVVGNQASAGVILIGRIGPGKG